MNIKKIFAVCVIFLVAGLLVSSAGFAAPAQGKKGPEEMFKQLDKNGDGKLSLEEFTAKTNPDKKDAREKVFKRLDKDGDGLLTQEEAKAMSSGGKKKKNK